MAAVRNIVVGSHLVAADTGEGTVVAGHNVKDLVVEALDERVVEDVVSGHSIKTEMKIINRCNWMS